MTRSILLLFLVISHAFGQSPELGRYMSEARKALADKNYGIAYDNLIKAQAFHPYHQGILYNLGLTAAATGRPDESIAYLRKALHINANYKLDAPELVSLKDHMDFQELMTLQKKLQTPVVNSDTAMVYHSRTLHAESVARDANGTTYLGGVHQAIIISAGKMTGGPLIEKGKYGLTSVLGLRLDKSGEFLWACSSPMEELEGYDSLAPSRVFKFKKSGKLVAQFEAPAKTGHIFGDLNIHPTTGAVFVSDSRTNEIYRVNEGTKKLDLFFISPEFWNIQGICFSDDGGYMFISDYIKGPYRLDLESRQLAKINSYVENSLKGIDGLLFYKGSLIALQNGTSPFRAMRFMLNSNLDAIVAAEIIDQGHPAMGEPTQGTIVEDQLFYVANSQWGGYDEKHKIKPESELQDVVILKCRLK
jgi:tetratricopeptide (TPR) repeat protein